MTHTVLITAADDPESSAASRARYDSVILLDRVREVFEADVSGHAGELRARITVQRRVFELAARFLREWLEGAGDAPRPVRAFRRTAPAGL